MPRKPGMIVYPVDVEAVKAHRQGVDRILTKFGVVGASQFGHNRAHKKLCHRLSTQGWPEDLSTEDRNVLEEMGFAEPKTPTAPALAGPTENPTAGKERVRKYLQREKAANAAKRAKAKGHKGDGGRKSKDGKDSAPVAKKGDGKATSKTGEPAKQEGISKSEAFRSLFAEKGASITRSKLMDKLAKLGAKPETVSSYIVWAKRPMNAMRKGIKTNPWGFRLVETENKSGDKVLQRK